MATTMANNGSNRLAVPSQEDIERLNAFWWAFAEKEYEHQSLPAISSRDRMDAWVIEQRMLQDRRANSRMTKAPWALVLATVLEIGVTIGQIYLHH
jgi:hypothetical protein